MTSIVRTLAATALLVWTVSACSMSADGSGPNNEEPDAQTARDAANTLDAADAAMTVRDCPDPPDAAEPGADFGTSDPTFGREFGRAKMICDARLSWECGNFFTVLDAAGCVSEVQNDSDASDDYLECLRAALTGACSPCEAGQSRRFYESCTIL